MDLPTPMPEGIAEPEPAPREEILIKAGWPPALIKACYDDYWRYEIRLSDGTEILFTGADIGKAFLSETDIPEWVHLSGIDVITCPIVRKEHEGYRERGMDVRVADIVWAADCAG